MASLNFRNLPIAAKLNVALSVSLILLFIVGLGSLTMWLSSVLENRRVADVSATNQLVLDMVGAYADSLDLTIERQNLAFAYLYPGAFSIDTSNLVETGGGKFPQLKHNGELVNGHDAPIDRFTAKTGTVATLLVRHGDDFVRIATSLKKADGVRSEGIPLGADHPAVSSLLKGEPFTGKARMFNRDYITRYLPIKDNEGKVIGGFFTGIDFTDGLKALKQKILAIKVGESGYVFAIDSGKEKGMLTIHPAKEGENILGAKDAAGHEFIREMVEKKNGIIHYPWKNGEAGARDKVSVYGYFPKWDWVVGSGSYTDEFTREVDALRIRIIGGAILMMLMAVTMVYLATKRWVTAPLRQAVSIMDRIAGGDLRVTVHTESQDEVGQLMQSTARMSENLRNAISSIHDTSDSLAAHASQFVQSSQDVAKGSEEQSDAASGMASAIEEMSASIQQVSEYAHEARQMAARAGETSAGGGKVIESAASEMSNIAGSVKESSATVEHLGEKSLEISAIVNTIKDIADQTNLLALNAAIEAARAGEQGRGFAVVADEVRKLAERTSQSTQEISAMIDSIQTGTRNAVSSMGQGVTQVEVGVELARQAGNSIVQIKKEASQVEGAVEGISAALREQSIASHDIAANIGRIVSQAEGNSQRAKESSDSAQNLEALAAELRGSVSHFRV